MEPLGGLDRLSEYYIKRSEQIRPVIQVCAGRIVDVTFSYSADVGDINTKTKIKTERIASMEGEG